MTEEKPPDVESFCYIVMHEACKNDPGILVTQAAHAAQECIRTLPVSSSTTFSVLEVASSAGLLALSKALNEGGIDHCLNTEPNAPWNGAATSLCTSPTRKSRVQPYFVGLPVLRKWEKKK